ncbi:MAG: sensor histidine kinase [Motiliproteus sp.]|nr:sensor histidine kinase [Motiliproteus sp.]MCW9052217.1 sensor histidine kinase [Motiliproteus sp.]
MVVIESSKTSTYSLEKSIRYRLFLVVIPMMMVLIVLVHQSVHLLVDGLIVDRLKQDSESLISSLVKKEKGWELDQRYLPHVYQRVKSGHYYLLQWQDNLVRSRSLWDKEVDVSTFKPGDTEAYLYHDIADEHWVIHKQEFIKDDQSFSLWVMEDIAQIEDKQADYGYMLLLVFVAFIAVFVFWQRRALQTGFARLEPVHRAINSNRISGALDFPEQIPVEIKPLVDSITLLVERSSDQVARSRMSVGNLAHELKRPLQELHIITATVGDEVVKERLQRVSANLQSRIEAELRRARISGSPMPGNLFSFEEELPHLQQLLNRVHHRDIEFDTQITQQQIPFDRDDMIELFGNLLDNAWKYAATRVVLWAGNQGAQWTIKVEDDGPGISSEEIQRANLRGVRIDEEPSRDGDGLGLSICQSIVDSYNGSISFSRSELGGLMVEITLRNLRISPAF